ncbi:ferruginol synthase-like [Salvia miltiorrhiza]|uniref:ferruginol synthase-like n=1 Tax=Salvia miltiorrhiza TaxID=226208 RepID=UPI0025AD3869|nr:ferruginol synthase-like [Salvia miltiorrhiza]
MDSLFLFPLVLALSLVGLTGYLFFRSGARRRLPPGPRPLPVVGNFLQLGKKPYETLSQLAKTHGPLMSIHLGSLYTVIVSSPEMAKELLQHHGQVFSGRTTAQVMHARDLNKLSMAFTPTGKEWRDKRKICKERVFSDRSLEGSEALRREKLQQLLDHVRRHCDRGDVVDLHDALLVTNLNLMLTTLFSTRSPDFESAVTREFKEIVEVIAVAVAVPNMADYFPILKPFDPQGIKRKAELYFGKLFEKFEGFLNQRLESRRNNPAAPRAQDLLETLVEITEGNDYNLTIQEIPYLLFDLFVGGSETNTTTIEWIMTELLFHPDKLRKLKEELNTVVGKNEEIRESDIPRLPYLQAVIKETLRYHPPGPLLLPRRSEADQEVNGYMIPKGAQILFNVWAMGRDPSIWRNPESFEPERFLEEKKVDFRGQHFELIPFGAGRRICPGMPLATRILQMTTAVLVHNFEWKLEKEKDDADHKGEVLGVALRRALPLRAIPFKI